MKEREKSMTEVLLALRSQHLELRRQAEQEDVQLIAALELSRLTDADLEPLRVLIHYTDAVMCFKTFV